jgi:hypothetical protein
MSSAYEGLGTAPHLSRRVVAVGGQAFPNVGNVVTNLPVTGTLSRPGESGDSTSWEGWSHVSEFVEEVSAGAA